MANSLNSSNYQNRIINLSDLQNQSQEMDLYNTDPEELLIQCKDEEELTEKICSLIKKIREKENKLFNRFLLIAFPSILIGFCIFLYTIKHLTQLSFMTVLTLLSCILASVYIPYGAFREYWLTSDREKKEKAYRIALVLWLKNKKEKSLKEFIEKNASLSKKSKKDKNDKKNDKI